MGKIVSAFFKSSCPLGLSNLRWSIYGLKRIYLYIYIVESMGHGVIPRTTKTGHLSFHSCANLQLASCESPPANGALESFAENKGECTVSSPQPSVLLSLWRMEIESFVCSCQSFHGIQWNFVSLVPEFRHCTGVHVMRELGSSVVDSNSTKNHDMVLPMWHKR